MRRNVAYILYCMALLLVLIALYLVGFEFFYPPQSVGSEIARQGFSVGVVIGIALRTIVLISLAVGALSLGLRIENPDVWFENTVGRGPIEEIAVKHKPQMVNEQPQEAIEFLQRTNAELADIYQQIDQNKHRLRFDALVWVICKRAENTT